MTGVRNNVFVVSLALLASLVGHVAIQRHFEHRARSIANERTIGFSSGKALRESLSELSEIAELEIPRFMGGTRHDTRVITAADAQPADESSERSRQTNSPPPAVPVPSDAAPVESPSREDTPAYDPDTAAVRDVIEFELSHASREEREIWFEELKSLPAGVVADLLQVRKQLHALPRLLGGMPEKLVSADPTITARSQEISAEPASQKIRFNLPDHHSTTSSLEIAISQLRHNLSNSATPGFKRLRVTLVDAYGSSWRGATSSNDADDRDSIGTSIQGEGCRIAPVLLDVKQGVLKKTVRELDLAIEGEGFFVVHRGEKEFLTRCGAFTLDRDRKLCSAIARDAILHPVIAIPEEAREIQISAKGVVTILKSGEMQLTEIGQLTLARVASPALLQPSGNALFAANEESGNVVTGKPMANGLGEIQQGFLEQSNVDFERELEELDEFAMILKALPLQNSRPATARASQHAPPR